jgi:hypothetical protein
VFLNLGVDKRTKQVLVDPQQTNSYSYARNNPITMKDPSGEIAFLALPAVPAILYWVGLGFTAREDRGRGAAVAGRRHPAPV